MKLVWRLLFCVAALALVAYSQEDAEDEPIAEGGDDEEGDGEEPEEVAGEDENEEIDGEVDEEEDLDPEKLKAIHGKIDKNNDGKTSMAEVLDYSQHARKHMAHKTVGEHMDMLDQNKDGKVTLDEMLGDVALDDSLGLSEEDKAREKEMQDMERAKFTAADKNKDGHLDKAELPAAVYPEIDAEVLKVMTQHTLSSKDTDSDGKLTLKEFFGSETAGEPDKEAEEEMKKDFEVLDLDKDGKLNHKEIERWESGDFHTANEFNQLFEQADTNKDSQLSAEELEAHLPHMKELDAHSHLSEWIKHDEF